MGYTGLYSVESNMTFYFRQAFQELFGFDFIELVSHDMKSAHTELAYIGVEVGRHGLLVVH